jgi:hypothetical protein
MLDLIVTHRIEEYHTLWKQGPRGQFRDLSAERGLTGILWQGYGWGVTLSDFDHDGAVDLALVNGYATRNLNPIYHEDGNFWSDFVDRNQLFANDGKGRFRDISLQNAPFCKTTGIYRGLLCGDIDNDGALDLVVTAIGGPARVFRNVVPNRGHWLMVRTVDPSLGGRDAYGAEVTVTAGQQHWLRLVNPGSSYLCSCDPRAHFGLGKVERVDRIRVLWPDGNAEEFPGSPADRSVVLERGKGVASRNGEGSAGPSRER